MVGAGNNAAHLHIGPGCLGLGLIVATALEAGLDVHLVARAGSKLPGDPRFKALEKGEAVDLTYPLPVRTFCKADTFAALPDGVRDVILRTPALLITVSATTVGFEQRHRFFLDVAAARAVKSDPGSTVFIPCENDPGASYPAFREELERMGVDCRDTMVNRLCPKLEPDSADGRLTVIVDEMAEWVVKGAPDRPPLRALDQVPHVSFTPDLAPFETRKRWLVNGAHLALAILARARNIPSVDQAAARLGRTKWLEKLHEGLIQALDRKHPGMEKNAEYAARHVAAWSRHEDEVTRILRRLKRADPEPFFDDLERKLIEPVALLGDLSAFPQVEYVFDRLHYLLQRGKFYVDFGEFSAFLPTLPTSVDVRMSARYEQALRPVLGKQEAKLRAESLGVALEGHRKAVRPF